MFRTETLGGTRVASSRECRGLMAFEFGRSSSEGRVILDHALLVGDVFTLFSAGCVLQNDDNLGEASH